MTPVRMASLDEPQSPPPQTVIRRNNRFIPLTPEESTEADMIVKIMKDRWDQDREYTSEEKEAMKRSGYTEDHIKRTDKGGYGKAGGKGLYTSQIEEMMKS